MADDEYRYSSTSSSMSSIGPTIGFLLIVLTMASFVFVFSNFVFLPIQLICIFNLVVGNASYLLLYLITCVHKKSYLSAPLALAMPLYWVLISIAAWRGLLQLITKPFYWEKTLHGVSKSVSYEKPLLD